MQVLFIILGAILGAAVAPRGGTFFAMLAGSALGLLFARLQVITTDYAKLQKRLERLEQLRLADSVNNNTAPLAVKSSPAPTATETWDKPAATPDIRADSPTPSEDRWAANAAARAPGKRQREPRPEPVAIEPSIAQKIIQTATTWLTTGNVPVKIGVIVSFFGVAFLLKYTVDRIDVVVPLALRYLIVALISAVVFGVGWWLRETKRTYALSLQGGGIGALYLTIFAAFRLHPMLPATLAFPLLVLLTAAIGWLAVRQDALVFAILATVGGFLAPVLISTGSGNHALLFGYYLLLNAGILAIAWSRSWRALNLLGFVFTFGIASLWGGQYYQPEYFATTEPFLIAFFLFYHAIAILYAFRQPPNLRGIVDATLIFGTPAIAFALQSALLADSEYGLAITALAVGVLYAATAWWLRGLKQPKMQLLVESYIALAVAFVTLSIPLAMDERWTAVAWALEGAALVWVGVRQTRLLSKLSGIALLFGSGVAFVEAGWSSATGPAIFNGSAMSGGLISMLSLWSAYRLERDEAPMRGQAGAVIALFVWGSAWWLGTGFAELDTRLSGNAVLHAMAAMIAVSALAAALIGAKLRWALAQLSTLLLLPAMGLLALIYLAVLEHVIAGAGALSWLLLVVAHFVALKLAADRLPKTERLFEILHFCGGLLIASIVSYEAGWRLDIALGSDTWSTSAALAVLVLTALGIVRGSSAAPWPLQRHANAYSVLAATLLAITLVLLTAAGINNPGDPAPLPYLPLLNPFDVLTLAGLALSLAGLRSKDVVSQWLDDAQLKIARYVWLAAAFMLTTIAVVRGVHHLGDIPWQQGTLMRSFGVQATLTIYWAMLGFGGMIAGVRRTSRETWAIGAGLMLLVVVKLLLIDMGGTGTLARIVSFLGVGGMLLVVGYFAPAPPKRDIAVAEGS